MGVDVARLRALYVIAGGALAGLGGAAISLGTNPGWTEGMTAGTGLDRGGTGHLRFLEPRTGRRRGLPLRRRGSGPVPPADRRGRHLPVLPEHAAVPLHRPGAGAVDSRGDPARARRARGVGSGLRARTEDDELGSLASPAIYDSCGRVAPPRGSRQRWPRQLDRPRLRASGGNRLLVRPNLHSFAAAPLHPAREEPVAPVEGIIPFTQSDAAIDASTLSAGSRALLRGLLRVGSTRMFPGGGAGIEYGGLLKTAARPDYIAAHVWRRPTICESARPICSSSQACRATQWSRCMRSRRSTPALLLKKSKLGDANPNAYPTGAFVIPSYTGEGDVVMHADPAAVEDIVATIVARKLAEQVDQPVVELELRVAGADDIIDKATMSQAVSESAVVIGEEALRRCLARHRAKDRRSTSGEHPGLGRRLGHSADQELQPPARAPLAIVQTAPVRRTRSLYRPSRSASNRRDRGWLHRFRRRWGRDQLTTGRSCS